MALKREVAKLEEVPEEHRALYVERDGKFFLDVDGGDDTKLTGALDKERKARVALEKTLSDLKKQMEGLDPVKAKEAMRLLAEFEEKADLGEIPEPLRPRFDEVVRKRTERMAADYQTKLGAAEGQVKTLNGRLEELLIDNGLRTAAAKAGIKPTALDDVVLFGRLHWRLDKDGKPVPMKGEEVQYGKDGKTPMSPDEWVAERATDRPHWFEGSSGGGAKGSEGPRVQGGAMTISRAESQNIQTYKARKSQAEKAGVELVIAQ